MIPANKYNVSVPRYTSYPPANYFEPMDSTSYLKAIEDSNQVGSKKLSFYFVFHSIIIIFATVFG